MRRLIRNTFTSITMTAAVVVALGAASIYKVATNPLRDWVRVARDANYDIALDRASVKSVEVPWQGGLGTAVEVWYRTDHALPRLHDDEKFDREIVRAIVRCDKLVFKVLSVDMSMGDGRPVARLRTRESDLSRQEWRSVERGTTEEIAASAACHFGHQDSQFVPREPPPGLTGHPARSLPPSS